MGANVCYNFSNKLCSNLIKQSPLNCPIMIFIGAKSFIIKFFPPYSIKPTSHKFFIKLNTPNSNINYKHKCNNFVKNSRITKRKNNNFKLNIFPLQQFPIFLLPTFFFFLFFLSTI